MPEAKQPIKCADCPVRPENKLMSTRIANVLLGLITPLVLILGGWVYSVGGEQLVQAEQQKTIAKQIEKLSELPERIKGVETEIKNLTRSQERMFDKIDDLIERERPD